MCTLCSLWRSPEFMVRALSADAPLILCTVLVCRCISLSLIQESGLTARLPSTKWSLWWIHLKLHLDISRVNIHQNLLRHHSPKRRWLSRLDREGPANADLDTMSFGSPQYPRWVHSQRKASEVSWARMDHRLYPFLWKRSHAFRRLDLTTDGQRTTITHYNDGLWISKRVGH